MNGDNPARSRGDRAAVFAALGEPVRLAIADQLVLGDASPGQLAGQFGLGTNLLAHHLHVLEKAGVIRRNRSEGDGRRSYIQLRLDDPIVRKAFLPVAPIRREHPVRRVVFVCTANTARSQFAAATWNAVSALPATSGGTHPGRRVHRRAVKISRHHGLDLTGAVPTGIENLVPEQDLVVAVCDNAHEELDPALPRLHWSVPDPVRIDTDAAFETAYAAISGRIDQLALAYATTKEAS
jgi:ArsR family transcriptional regulator, arsenate/arsenite/antimonite-responsive transcriptional repressor / arsenate reductase (thioredoxin)